MERNILTSFVSDDAPLSTQADQVLLYTSVMPPFIPIVSLCVDWNGSASHNVQFLAWDCDDVDLGS